MAFEPKKIDLNAINGNSEYKKGDALQPSAVNEMVKGILYAQENGGSGTNIEIDSELSLESENAVQNKVVTEALGKKLEEEDLTNYVKNTDYASETNYGLVKTYFNQWSSGLEFKQKMLKIYPAGKTDINAKTSSSVLPITPANLDYAVMKGLTDPIQHTWTDPEKELARATLGITSGGTYLHSIVLVYNATGEHGVTFEETTSDCYLYIQLISNKKEELKVEDFSVYNNSVELLYMASEGYRLVDYKFTPIECVSAIDLANDFDVQGGGYEFTEPTLISRPTEDRYLQGYYLSFGVSNSIQTLNSITSVTDTVTEL